MFTGNKRMVSGIITTYNREAAIVERALQSILAQTYPVSEILVVDDNKNGSTYSRHVESMCHKYSKVRYIKQDGNKGACAARNLGIAKACGQYIGFLDDDDIWLPQKIEKQVAAFCEHDERVGIVFCHGIERDEQIGKEHVYYNKLSAPLLTFRDMLRFDFIGTTSNPLIKKACFDEVGGFWEEQPARQDYEMWLRILQKSYTAVSVEGDNFIYMVHGGKQITKENDWSYTGYKNIYNRYKEDFAEYPRARINILNSIIRSRTKITPEVLKFYLERQILQIVKRMPRDDGIGLPENQEHYDVALNINV